MGFITDRDRTKLVRKDSSRLQQEVSDREYKRRLKRWKERKEGHVESKGYESGHGDKLFTELGLNPPPQLATDLERGLRCSFCDSPVAEILATHASGQIKGKIVLEAVHTPQGIIYQDRYVPTATKIVACPNCVGEIKDQTRTETICHDCKHVAKGRSKLCKQCTSKNVHTVRIFVKSNVKNVRLEDV